LLVDSNKDLSGLRNLTATGTIQAANFTGTGNTQIGDAAADTVAMNATITTNLIFEGSTDNAYETTLAITDPTADRTWTIPDATDTSVGRATTDTLTNKTLTAPDINTPDIDGGTVDAITSLTVANNVDIGSYDLRAGTLTADGLTSGRVVFASTNGVLSDDSDLSFSGATLSATNLTSSGTVTYGSLSDGSITITAFVDEDGMDSDSATLVPTQQSVKAYVDAQVTAQDLDLTTDSGTIAIDLDSETLTLTGGTGVDTSASSNTVTFALDLNELTTETTIADADFIAMVDATDSGSGKITFENLEDAIFSSVSGDVLITEAGVATIQANSVALGTDTTGNYVATIADSGGGGITVANSGSESAAVTLELDIKGLTDDAIASGDFIAFSDEGESGDPANRGQIDDVATLFAGTGLTASSSVISIDAAQTVINSLLATDIKIGEDDQTKIDFEDADKINFYAGNEKQLILEDGALYPGSDNIIDLGKSDNEFKDGFFDGTVTADAFAGPLTGNVTGTSSKVTVTNSTANTNFPVVFNDESDALLDDTGSLYYNPSTETLRVPNLSVAGTTTTVDTVTMNAQNAIVFEGATADSSETTLSIVDPTADHTQYLINQGGYIPVLAAATTTAITSTPAELNILDGATLSVAELNILDGVTATAAEINLIDGGTARGTTAVASGDGILINDGGTMRMTNVDTVSTYFASHNVGGGNIVTTGAINSGSITSGFGTIDTGSSNITTTGVGAFGSLDISGNVDVDGTLESDAYTVNGTALDEFIADTVGAMVGSNTETGIAVTYEDGDNTLDFVLGATQTTLTSILNASLVAGRDADNQIKFSTDDQIIFRVAGGDGVTMKASGEIEATSLDISGNADIDGTLAVAGATTINSTDNSVNLTLKSTDADNASGPLLELYRESASGADDDYLGIIRFSGKEESDGSKANYAQIISRIVDASAGTPDGRLDFEVAVNDSGTTIMSIADGVGIGTSSPSYKLHVAEDKANEYAAYIINDNADGSGLRLRCDDSDGDEYLFYAENSTTARFAIKSDGNVGIGHATPQYGLTIAQGTADANKIGWEAGDNVKRGSIHVDGSSDDMIFQVGTSNNERMRIESDGTVVMKGATQFEGNTTVTADNARFGVGASASGHWASGFDVLSVGHSTQLACETADSADRNAFWTNNLYYDGTGSGANVYRRLYTDEASMVQQRAGTIRFFTDASGTADADFAPTERMRIDSDGKVGIGEDSPDEKLHVKGGAGTTIQVESTAANDARFMLKTTSTQYTIGANEGGRGNDTLSIDDDQANAERLRIKSDGEIDGNFNDTSDRAQKENIKDLTNTLEGVKALNPSTFNWIKEKAKGDKTKIGFIAQDVEAQFPELVDGKEGEKSISTIGLVSVLTKAVQELSAKVEALENA